MENQTLHLDFDLNPEIFRRVWFDEFKKTLPATLAFWGTGFLCSMLLLVLLKGGAFFLLLSLTFAAVPAIIIIQSYRSHNVESRRMIAELKASNRNIHLTFAAESDGFDYISGGDFGHVSWKTIKSVDERKEYYIFHLSGSSPFFVPKYAFRHQTEVDFFRSLVAVKTAVNEKLLDKQSPFCKIQHDAMKKEPTFTT